MKVFIKYALDLEEKLAEEEPSKHVNTETKEYNNESLNTYLLSVFHGQGNYFITQAFIIPLGTWHSALCMMVSK